MAPDGTAFGLKYFRAARAAALALSAAAGFALPAAADPVFSLTDTIYLVPSGGAAIRVDSAFDNVGTNPRFTDAVFSTRTYHDITLNAGWLRVIARTAEELNALALPPPSPFTVTAEVTMANDDGQTAWGTITFRTTYDRDTSQPSEPEAPTFSDTEARNAPAGVLVSVWAEGLFDNAGTNPKITDAVFSTTEYYSEHSISRDRLFVLPKTDAELSAMTPPPPNPFSVDVTVMMANDEGQTASGTVTFRTEYQRTPAPVQ